MSSFLENLVRRGMGEASLEAATVLPGPVASVEPDGEPGPAEWGEETIEVSAAPPASKSGTGTPAPSVDLAQRGPAPAAPVDVPAPVPPEGRAAKPASVVRAVDQPRADPRRAPDPVRLEPDLSPVIRESAATPEEPVPRASPPSHAEPRPRAEPKPALKDTGGQVSIRETPRDSGPPQPARAETIREQPSGAIETVVIQPGPRLTTESRVIERIETRLERQERIVERLTEDHVEREVQREPAGEQIERQAQDSPVPIRIAPNRQQAQAGEATRQSARAPAPAQLTASVQRPMVKPTPAMARFSAPALPPTPRRAPVIERRVDVRIGTIEVRANVPPPPAAPRAAEEQPAAEEFGRYRGLRDFSGWFRG